MSDAISLAIEQFNTLNGEDPNQLEVDGEARPKELVHAERLEAWVRRVNPDASVALLLASRCQHLMRWTVPRSDYPEGRVGYLKWRKDLSRKHADRAGEVLRELSLDTTLIEAVRTINLKQELKTNPDSQAMEDALCLSFLAHEFVEFSEKHTDEKVVDIVQKTWRKMSERGHSLALELSLEGRAKSLVTQALSA